MITLREGNSFLQEVMISHAANQITKHSNQITKLNSIQKTNGGMNVDVEANRTH